MADMFDKEELSTVAGLFSNTLATAEAERQAQQEAAFRRYSGGGAAQNPLALLAGLSGMFGTAAGQELRGAGGFETPLVKTAALREQATSRFDKTTPEGLYQIAQFLNERGDGVGARQAVMLAEAQQQRMATLTKTGAETVRAMRERDPEIIRLQNTRDALEQQFGPTDRRVIELTKIIEGKSKAGQTTIQMPDTRGKAFEAADPDALKDYRKESRAASGQLFLIAQARENLPRAVVGQGLPALIRGLNTQLAPLGINTEQVAETRNLEQALKSIIAQGIKQYGANPSTVDLQFAVSAAADIKDPLEAIKATLNYLEKRAKGNVNKADAAEQYLLDNKNLAGFEKKWTEQSLRSMLPKPPEQAITLLLSNPALATQFDAKYGEGASKQYLGKK